MINKIGLKAFNEDNICIFGYRNYNETLVIEENMKPLKKIHDIIIDSEVIMQKVRNYIGIITMFLNVKIIYTTENSETLYVLEKKLIKAIKVKIPVTISDDIIRKIENKSIMPEIYIYDVNGVIQTKNSLDLSIFITATYQSLNNENILLLITFDNIKTNMYEFKTTNSELTQKTFYNEENLILATFDKDILFIKEYNGEHFLCEIINENIVETPLPYIIQNPISLNKISENTYIITWQKYDEYIISKLDHGKLYNKFTKALNHEPIYNVRENKVLYIIEENESLALMYSEVDRFNFNNEQDFEFENRQGFEFNSNEFDFNSNEFEFNSEIIISDCNLKKYNLSSFGNFIAYTLDNNYTDDLFIYCTQTGEHQEIHFPIKTYKIRNIRFSNNEDLLMIVVKSYNTENLYIYNILKESLVKVTRNVGETEISSFYINYINNCMYLSQKDNGDCNLYTISLNNFAVKDVIYLNSRDLKIITKT